MPSRPRLALAILALTVSGCAQSDPFTARRTMIGSLKTGLSRLEFENDGLRKELAELKTENRRVEERLVQERNQNGDLAARLDDARNLLGQKGLDTGNRDSDDWQNTPTVRRSARPTRKPPSVAIPRLDPQDRDVLDEEEDFDPPPRRKSKPELHGSLDDSGVWLPVARGNRRSDSSLR